jgi:AraC family transcriptional regulator, transcriptional activator of pobA
MSQKTPSIPINALAPTFNTGIIIHKVEEGNLVHLNEANHSHRHDYHIFFLLKKGEIEMEIDFEKQRIGAPALLYINPSQVHRVIDFINSSCYLLGIDNDNLRPQYLQTLEQSIFPPKFLALDENYFDLLHEEISLLRAIFEQKTVTMHTVILQDHANAFIGLAIAQYLIQMNPKPALSRFETITKSFKLLLERSFTQIKFPSDYAEILNISTSYLNECVSNTTGLSVSHHIQQRVILEAKRLLYHSDLSVKEIAHELGYEDHAYFSRLFNKVTQSTALTFRKKHR